ARAALRGTPRGHHARPNRLGILGAVLLSRHALAGADEDLAEAVTVARDALAEEADPASHPELPANLSLALVTRFEAHGDPADLDAAVDLFRAARRATRPDQPARAGSALNLALALSQRYQRSENRVDIDEALERGCEAVETSSPGTERDRAVRVLEHLIAV